MDAPEDLFRAFLSRLVLDGTRFIDPCSPEDRNGFRAAAAALTAVADHTHGLAAYKKTVRIRNLFHEENNGAFPKMETLLRPLCTGRRIALSAAFAQACLGSATENERAIIGTAATAFTAGRRAP